ncbi:MAG: porin [Burkholderiales bacterium]
MDKKTAVALAVGAMFAAPALAQTSSVQIYGKFYPQFAIAKTSSPTAAGAVPSNLVTSTGGEHARRNSVDTQNSYIGFRGNEKLGGSLAVIWQIEQAITFDSPSEFWANRNSFLGLRGGFGTLKFGNMDTIYKEYGDQFSMFGINSGNFTSASNTLSMIGVGRDNSARFHERRESSVQYETPEFGNFTFGVQYGPDETKGNPGTDTDASLWSYGVKYEADRLYVSVHQERHNDFFGGSNNATAVANSGANPSSKDTGTRLSVAYKLTKEHTLTADIARLEYDESGQGGAGEFENYERTNFSVGWEARWGGGPFRTGIQYIKMNEGKCSLTGGVACNTDGLDGSQVSLGAAYDLSSRTFLYALFARLANGESAQFDNWANGSPSRGTSVTQMAVGVQHRF